MRASWQARIDSIGVEQDRGMVEKKRTDERKPPENGNLSPRTREASGPLLLGGAYAAKQDVRPQFTEEPNESLEKSDLPIVVRDGKTDHMEKGQADGQRSQSTDARGKNVPTRSVSSTLTALNRKAVEDKNHRFQDLYRLIDLQMLYTSFRSVKRNAAPGVDGVTYEDYESNIDEHLRTLLDCLINKRYRAQPVRRHYTPKGNTGKQRPLGIPALEDKIVQHAASQILERIYEADFSEHSWGYRRGKPGAREASKELARTLDCGTYRWVVEADIKSFLDPCSYYTLGDRVSSKSCSLLSITLICRPLRLPRCTWTAGNSFRFTRCMIVCRETPSFRMASGIVT